MIQEQIEIADKLVDKFNPFSGETITPGPENYAAIQCAIQCCEVVIGELNKVPGNSVAYHLREWEYIQKELELRIRTN